MYAAMNGHVECTELLLNKGALVNIIGYSGTTLFRLSSPWFVQHNNATTMKCVSLLLAYGTYTTFTRACHSGSLELAVILIQSGAIDDTIEMNYDLSRIQKCVVIVQILYHIDCRNAEIEAKRQRMQAIKAATRY